MIEEQALCRVHRVGQQRNVTTVRYLMKDSFEEVCISTRYSVKLSVTFCVRIQYKDEDHCANQTPQQVVEIQKRKKLLAKVTFCQDPLSEAGIELGTLQVCLTLLLHIRAMH